MKKLLKIMTLLLVCNFSYSQIYYSNYLDATSEWKVIEHHGEAGYHDLKFRTYFFEGTENLNGFTYYKMYQTYYAIGFESDYSVLYPQSNNVTQFIGYFREDPNGKFYLYNNSSMPFFFNNQFFNNGIETVFFDNQIVLNSQVGDMYFNTSSCQVDLLSVMNINSNNYKLISSSFGGKSLEGIGKILDSCISPQSLDNTLATFIRIHCYTKQGQTYNFYNNYHLPNFLLVDCNTFPNANRQGLSTLSYENSIFKVFPNPARTIVNVVSNNKNVKEITLYDLQGRVLKTLELNKISTELDISNFQSGTYLITIKTDYGTSNSKIIIE